MHQILDGYLKFFVDNHEVANFKVDSSDFDSEKSLMLGDIYCKNDQWKFNAVGQGFLGGLESLIEYFGSAIDSTQSTKTDVIEIEQAIKFTGNIFSHITEKANQIEEQWSVVFQGICNAGADYPHIDVQHFNELNAQMNEALQQLRDDLENPTLILATTGTTSSGKSTIVNLLCGADLMPRMAQEMSAGVVHINHDPDKKYLKVRQTDGALWECGEWHDLSDEEIRNRLTNVMDSFNTNRGVNQPATPYIELTYPIACFGDSSLLKLSGIPKNTQFKIMDLPGLRNQQDNTNADDIKNCKDALCVVAYNMEETDENRRLELVRQILEQIKQMGGSPARMLFALNRIDVFRKDPDWERYQTEHIAKTQAEIKKILSEELPEHRDKLEALSYCPLSSLPALHAQRIKVRHDQANVAEELDKHFNSLIPKELLDDLPRNTERWNDHDFNRISDIVWQNSYGNLFFQNLDSHIQAHFPTLVIPTIVNNFDSKVSKIIGEAVRTCHSEMNSSKEAYQQACELLQKQNAEMREFLSKSMFTLSAPFNSFAEEVKKNSYNSMLYEELTENLVALDIYNGRLTQEKLSPLYTWQSNLRVWTLDILVAMKQSLNANGNRYFSKTKVEMLPKRLQDSLGAACDYYSLAMKRNDEIKFESQLSFFLSQLNSVIGEALEIQSKLENSRIHDCMDLIMKHYLDYLREGIKKLALEWNLTLGYHILDELQPPKLRPFSFDTQIQNKSKVESRKERNPWTLLIFKRTVSWTVNYKALPSYQSLYDNGSAKLFELLDELVLPFNEMILDYIDSLNNKITVEQEAILFDFEEKMRLASEQHHADYQKVLNHWQPLHEESKKLSDALKQLVSNGISA